MTTAKQLCDLEGQDLERDKGREEVKMEWDHKHKVVLNALLLQDRLFLSPQGRKKDVAFRGTVQISNLLTCSSTARGTMQEQSRSLDSAVLLTLFGRSFLRSRISILYSVQVFIASSRARPLRECIPFPSRLALSLLWLKSQIKTLTMGKALVGCEGCGSRCWIIYQSQWAGILNSISGRKLFEVGFVLESLVSAFTSTFWPLNLIWCFLCFFVSQVTSFSFLEQWIDIVCSLVFL